MERKQYTRIEFFGIVVLSSGDKSLQNGSAVLDTIQTCILWEEKKEKLTRYGNYNCYIFLLFFSFFFSYENASGVWMELRAEYRMEKKLKMRMEIVA